MAEKLRVAAAGTGYFSHHHFDAWNRCPEVKLVGVAGLDSDAVMQAAQKHEIGARFSDVAEMLDSVKPDLFDIITPPSTHFEMIKLAAERGIDAICQKPFCGDLETASRAVDLAERHGISVTVHENFRFQPWYIAIKRELDGGLLGRTFRAHFRLRPGDGQGSDAYLERQPYFQKMPRFLVHETAVHLIDVVRSFFGEPETVSADIARLNSEIAGEDSAIIVLGFDDGMRAIIDGNRLSDHKAEDRRRTMGEVVIEGEKGSLDLNGDGKLTFRAHGENVERQVVFDWNDHGFGGDCVYLFTRHVVDHYVAGTPVSNSARDYLTNLKIEEAVYASAEDGRRHSL